jgi:hypothetical protein
LIATGSPTAHAGELDRFSAAPPLDQVDPLFDERWPEFLRRHPQASVFHSRGWLNALQDTYGYKPVAFTSTLPGQPLRDAAVFCEVKSWLVRPRLVSLPFSDHTELLLSATQELAALLSHLANGVREGRWTSVEFRPPGYWGPWPGFSDGPQFIVHRLNLEPSLEFLFAGFNKDSTQRKIRRAMREQLKYEEGRSEELLRQFFRLVVLTRRRKALPPPPLAWFRNVVKNLGEDAKIRIARTNRGELAGGILTLAYKDKMLFKYGASDARFHNLGTMPFLLWQAIQDAKARGASTFDFGRSDIAHRGLIRFKDHFGAEQTPLVHKAFPPDSWEPGPYNWKMKAATRIFGMLPDSALTLAGRLIYPHIG